MDWQDAMPFGGLLGIEAVGASPEEVRLRLAWREELCTAGGLHARRRADGASPTAPAGSARSSTCRTERPARRRSQSSTSFLRPVRDGYAEAISRPLSVGRTVIAVETDVVDAAGRAVARVVQSQAVLR